MSQTTTATFAQRLTEAIAAKSMSTAEVVAACKGVFAPRSLTRWKSGANVPGLEVLPYLSQGLGVSVEWLLGVSDDGGPAAPNHQE